MPQSVGLFAELVLRLVMKFPDEDPTSTVTTTKSTTYTTRDGTVYDVNDAANPDQNIGFKRLSQSNTVC